MDKYYRILTDFKFSRDAFLHICKDIFDGCITASKYKDKQSEINKGLGEELLKIEHKLPKRLPLISSLLLNIKKYGDILNAHPSINTIQYILIPEIVDLIESVVFQYITTEGEEYHYNHYCSNVTNYRFKIYRRNLLRYSSEVNTHILDEYSTKLSGETFKRKTSKAGRPKGIKNR